MRFKTIIRNINVLNILLISVIIMSISYSLFPLLDIKVKYTLPTAKKTVEDTKEKAVQTQTPSIAEYTMIAEENLFHPERKIPVEKKEEKPLPKPDFVLYGTLITDDISLAYLEDLKAPYSTPGRGKRQTALRKGDTMSGFTLKEIGPENIVMVRGEENMIVNLNDSSHPKGREVSAVPGAPGQPTPPQPPSRSIPQSAPSSVQQPAASQQKTLQPPTQPGSVDKKNSLLNIFKRGRNK
jgi:type II secretory pathway component PulC